MPFSHDYEAVNGFDAETKGSDSESASNPQKSSKPRLWLLIVSGTLNILFMVLIASLWKLPRNVVEGSPYEQDRLWEDYQVGAGTIALKNNVAKELNLPESEMFPWDISRSIYLTVGHHDLHCLKKIRRYATQMHRGQTPFDDYPHIAHCLDALRQSIICHADDTPMARKAVPGTNDLTGNGQARLCRDWGKLEEWAVDNTACFKYINETEGYSKAIELFKFCPKDSIFAPNARKYFGLPDDWHEEPWETVPDYSPQVAQIVT